MDNKPISMWGYFGYQILFALPVVGWILVIIFAFASPNVNVRNFARSYFCILIVIVALLLFALVTGGGLAVAEIIAGLLS